MLRESPSLDGKHVAFGEGNNFVYVNLILTEIFYSRLKQLFTFMHGKKVLRALFLLQLIESASINLKNSPFLYLPIFLKDPRKT